MKTYRNLYLQIADFANLYTAFRVARKGKRARAEVAECRPNVPGTIGRSGKLTLSNGIGWLYKCPALNVPSEHAYCLSRQALRGVPGTLLATSSLPLFTFTLAQVHLSSTDR